MAFQVTQCPRCESTFNTDPRVLELAAGRVRCGACLAVFSAVENFLEADTSRSEADESDSVFIGNSPEDFFDPAVFLTRSALREQTDIQAPDTQAPHIPASTHHALDLESHSAAAPDTVINANAAESIDSPELAAAEDPDQELVAQTQTIQDDDSHLEFFSAVNDSLENIEEFDGIEDLQTIAELKALDNPNADMFTAPWEESNTSDTDQQNSDSIINEEFGIDAEDIELYESNASEIATTTENQEPILDNPQAITTIDQSIEEEMEAVLAGELGDSDELRDSEESKDAEELRISADQASQAPTAIHIEDETALTDAEETGTEKIGTEESEPVELDAIRHEPPARPEDITLSISFAVEPRANTKDDSASSPDADPNPDSHPDQTTPTSEASPEPAAIAANASDSQETSPTAAATNQNQEFSSDTSTAAFNRAIEEDEFAATIADGDNSEPQEQHLDIELELDELAGSEADSAPASGEDLASTEESDIHHSTQDSATDPEADQAAETSTEAIRARARQAAYQDDEALEVIPEAHLQALDTMTPPVELVAGMPKAWGRHIALGVLSLILGAIFALQYTWREIDRYAEEPLVRSVFQWLCGELDCQLPAYTNIDAIRSNNLTVRSHPERPEGLFVAVEIRNSAAFPQPFPIMILSFNSPSNDVIALREFAPNEYLDPGLQDVALMPVLAPVQVSLEIVDPGGDAVNYTMAFRLP